MLDQCDCNVQDLAVGERVVVVSAAGAVRPWRWMSEGLHVCVGGTRTLAGVAAGSWAVFKAILGIGDVEFLEKTAFPFKMEWAWCPSPTALGVPGVIVGAS